MKRALRLTPFRWRVRALRVLHDVRKADIRPPLPKTSKPGWKQSASREQELCGAIPCGSSDKPKSANSGHRCLFSFWSQLPGPAREGTTVHAPSSGARLSRPLDAIPSDAWKAVHGPPWSRNGLQACRIGSARDQRGGCSLDLTSGSLQSLNYAEEASELLALRSLLRRDSLCLRDARL